MASSEQTSPKPNDLVMESLRDACYPMEGSIDSVQLVADTTREDAIERFARDVGVDEGEVRCTQTAARILTRQQAWDRMLASYWDGPPDLPLRVPDDWPADDPETPCWDVCAPGAKGAEPIYLLEVRDA